MRDGKDPVKVANGKRNVQARPDYQISDRLESMVVAAHATPHEVKIGQYRDRLLSALAPTTPKALFDLLDDRSMTFLGKLNDNTEIARYSDMCRYVEYCNAHDIPALPFQDYGVDAYLSMLLAEGRKRSSIDRFVSSLVAWADILELDDPRRSFKVKARMAEIRKKVKNKRRQAEGFRVEHLERALALFNPDIPRDVHDIALLFVGFETMCRQSELVNFDWEDLHVTPEGSAILELDSSKTDQDGEGAELYLSRNTTDLLLGWQQVSRQRSGAIFRGIYSNGLMGARLADQGVMRAYRRTATRLGLEPSVFSGHSSRVGAAQEMVERNIETAKIMLSGRWKTVTMVTQYAKRIKAKRSGIADLTRALGWDGDRDKTGSNQSRITVDQERGLGQIIAE